MTIDAAVWAVVSGGVGLGLYIVFDALRQVGWFASLRQSNSGPTWLQDTRAIGALLIVSAAVLLAIALRSVVILTVVAAALWLLPRLRSGKAQRDATIARTEAIASWTEMLRDSIAAASGIEDAIRTTGSIAPPAIATEVHRLAQRLDSRRNVRLVDALESFAEDVDHPSADLVVAALVCAARVQAKDLASLLTSLAETTRDDARMRVRIEVDRARTRTAAKLVMLVAATTLGLVFAFSRDYLAIYSTSSGQFVLLAVAGIFATGLWLMERLAIVDPPERFVIRKTRRTMDAG